MNNPPTKRVRYRRFSFLAFSVLIAILAIFVLTVLLIFSQRESLLEGTNVSLLYDATLISRSYDAGLRVADLAVDNLLTEFQHNLVPEEEQRFLTALAFQIPEAENLYLLDSEGSILSTAYKRLNPELIVDSENLSRLLQGAQSDCLILQAPSEGGNILVLLKVLRYDKPVRYAAILFSGKGLHGRLTALLSRTGSSIVLRDKRGESFLLGRTAEGEEFYTDRYLSASTKLSSWPVTVSLFLDREEVLREWKTRAVFQIVSILTFMIVVAGMFAFGLVLLKRAAQADILKKELEINEVLFKEVNHRVKNNLSIVQSVLSLAADRTEDLSPEEILRSAVNRISSIALLHNLLYRTGQKSEIDLGLYLKELSGAIAKSFPEKGSISLEVKFERDLFIPFNTAVDCGMVVNELVTNSFKHAFHNLPGEGSIGRIVIETLKTGNNTVKIRVMDNGSGFDETSPDRGGMGMEIVNLLIEKMEASLERSLNEGSGTLWTILLPG